MEHKNIHHLAAQMLYVSDPGTLPSDLYDELTLIEAYINICGGSMASRQATAVALVNWMARNPGWESA